MSNKRKDIDWTWILLILAGLISIYFGLDGLISGEVEIRRSEDAAINNSKFRFYFYVTCYFVLGLAAVIYSVVKMIRRESSNG